MNIEELELSLRTEFEGQIRNVVAEVRQNVADFQKKFEAEFEKHRTELERTITDLSDRLPETAGFDAGFSESVTEHLRLARDDGAQVAAIAFGEAEKLKAESEPAAKYDLLRDAINEIGSKTTQSTILQSLVEHAGHFTPRGAFFIVKNEHLVGWKSFGRGVSVDDAKVREIHFPVSTDTVLSSSVRSMSIAAASANDGADDAVFLDALNFGRPEKMYAIPLTARGRGVAVLYADHGNGGELNVEALETLVRVAGLTVELLAASQAAPAPTVEPATAPVGEQTPTVSYPVEAPVAAAPVASEQEAVQEYIAEPAQEPVQEYMAEPVQEQVQEYVPEPVQEAVEEYVPEPVQEEMPAVEEQDSFAPAMEETVEAASEYTGEVTFEPEPEVSYVPEPSSEIPEVERFEPVAETVQESFAPVEAEAESVPFVETAAEYALADSYEASDAVEEIVEEYVPAPVSEDFPVVANGNGVSAQVVEPVVEVVSAQPARTRLSDRNVDLPIEVADDERRLHNDARRFARLLVSEIKLYNEQKVVEGREGSDLYDRLREAIDRSREMYDKRVQPAVASKFDYFHYELVNSLAEGEAAKLGGSYPGAVV